MGLRRAIGPSTLMAACLLVTGQVSRAEPIVQRRATDTELAREATRDFGPGAAVNRRFLLEALGSGNYFRRKLALEELAKYPGLIDGDIVAALVPCLEETTPLPPVWCVPALDQPNGATDDAEPGMALAFSQCARIAPASNGSLAAKLLQGRSAFPLVVAYVSRRPQSAEGVIQSLGEAGLGPVSQVASSLNGAKQPDVQAALLRLVIAASCEPAPATLPATSVTTLAVATDARVSRLASLAVLRLADCRPDLAELNAPRKAAAVSFEARLRDLADRDVVDHAALLGRTARAFVPSLLARFGRVLEDQTRSRAILAIISALGVDARSAVPILVGVLRDEKRSGYLWKPALTALGAIGPPAATAKPAILGALRASDIALLAPAVEALARTGARLDRSEFVPLAARYHERCDFGVSRPVVRPIESCPALSKGLSRLAAEGGHPFSVGPSGH